MVVLNCMKKMVVLVVFMGKKNKFCFILKGAKLPYHYGKIVPSMQLQPTPLNKLYDFEFMSR